MTMVNCKVTTIANDDTRNLGSRGVGRHYGVTWGVGVSSVYWGLAETLGFQGPEGV